MKTKGGKLSVAEMLLARGKSARILRTDDVLISWVRKKICRCKCFKCVGTQWERD